MDSNRQVVVATYKSFVPFVVPKGIDLNAPGVEYFVKWKSLLIKLSDGTEIEVEPADEIEIDYKYPNKVEIEKGEDWEHLLEDEAEEEEEKSE
jgi:hypothetical protein